VFLSFLFWTAIGTLIAIVYASIFEWLLHRFIMHRPFGPFTYPYKTHHLVHHRIFKSDHTYHLINDKDKWTIPMAWWNGPALVATASLPFVLASLLSGSWGILAGAALACSSYYGAYEYIHWCMHLPKRRHVERSGIFFRLNGHHLLHHRYMNRNYNVVLPLADLCFGTLMLRSKVHFKQASGPSVPNVQPKRPALELSTRAQ
jgi:sterol desaturase/sphingolipid hydroxylase (fatty acid hydroxylase superfamily)